MYFVYNIYVACVLACLLADLIKWLAYAEVSLFLYKSPYISGLRIIFLSLLLDISVFDQARIARTRIAVSVTNVRFSITVQ